MSNKHDKRYYRKLKKDLKREGNQRKRHHFKRLLQEDPEDVRLEEDYNFGSLSSKVLNGLDKDPTRRREAKPDTVQDPLFENSEWHSFE